MASPFQARFSTSRSKAPGKGEARTKIAISIPAVGVASGLLAGGARWGSSEESLRNSEEYTRATILGHQAGKLINNLAFNLSGLQSNKGYPDKPGGPKHTKSTRGTWALTIFPEWNFSPLVDMLRVLAFDLGIVNLAIIRHVGFILRFFLFRFLLCLWLGLAWFFLFRKDLLKDTGNFDGPLHSLI